MPRLIMGTALALAFAITLAAQAPEMPNSQASDTAKTQGAEHRPPGARHHRGTVERSWGSNPNAATPAVRATPAVPAHGAGLATPATPATPAVPASPSHTPTSPGQAHGHRP